MRIQGDLGLGPKITKITSVGRVQQLEENNQEMKLNVCRLKSQTEKLDQVGGTGSEPALYMHTCMFAYMCACMQRCVHVCMYRMAPTLGANRLAPRVGEDRFSGWG